QGIANCDGLDIGFDVRSHRVGDQRERLVRGKRKWFVIKLAPDHLVYALRVPRPRRKKIYDQQVDTRPDERDGLADKFTDCTATALVPRRYDFDDGDNGTVRMADGDPIRLPCIYLNFRTRDEASFRRTNFDCYSAGRRS